MKIAYASGGNTNISLELKELSFKEFSLWFSEPQIGKKNTVGYFIRGGDMVKAKEYTTSGGTTYKNIYPRNNEYLKSADLLVLDIDKGSTTPKEMYARLKKLGFACIIYTSPSHTKALPRYRVILRCKLPSLDYLHPSLSAFRELLKLDASPAAGEEGSWSNAWYFPVQTEDYQMYYSNGKDVPAVKPTDVTRKVQANKAKASSKKQAGRSVQEQIQIISEGLPDTGVNQCIGDFAYGQIQDGVPAATVEAMLHGFTSWIGYPHSDYIKDIPRQVKCAVGKRTIDLDSWPTPQPIPSGDSLYKEILFPLDYLPESMLRAAQEIADFNLMSVHDVAPAMLIATCMCINKRAMIQAGSKSLEVYFHLSGMFIADSGRFKSTVYNMALKGAQEGDAELSRISNTQKKIVQSQVRMLESTIKKFEAKAIKGNGADPVSVDDILRAAQENGKLFADLEILQNTRVPGYFIDDVTEERAIEKAFNAGGITNFVAEEGQGIIKSWTKRYSGSANATDFALRGMSGSMYRNDRKGNDKPIEFRPVISCMIFVQPDIYESQFLANQDINSSGMRARILPIYWHKGLYGVAKKTTKNDVVDVSNMQTYWDVTKSLIMYDDQSSTFHYETDDLASPQLIKPTTKICMTEGIREDCNELFNKYWYKYADGQENEGLQEVLNKTGTMAYIMAGCIYAYEHHETFFQTPKHTISRKMFNCISSFTEYLVQKKKSENNLKVHSVRVEGARKVLKSLTNNTNVASALEGMPMSHYHRAVNYNRATTDTDKVDAGLDLLIELDYVKIDGVHLILNPKYTTLNSNHK